MDFRTNNTIRMRITPTGLVGVSNGLNAPLSLYHLNSNGNAIGDETFRTSSPGTGNAAWRMFTGAGNGTARASFYTQPNNNVFTEVQTANSIYGIRTGDNFQVNTGLRMLIVNDGVGGLNGRIALGENLQENFVPQDRLHLYHETGFSNVRVRFGFRGLTADGLDIIGNGASDGTVIGIDLNGEYRIIQHEDRNIAYFIPDAGVKTGVVGRRMFMVPGGRTYVGRNAPALATRFTIESNLTGPVGSIDAKPSGLRFC